MRPKHATRPEISREQNHDLTTRFEKALEFYRSRSPVVFVSQRYRFWEPAGFVQQSLAKYLVENGVAVTWLDGAGWRSYEPHVPFQSNLLTVKSLRQLPLRRMGFVDSLDTKYLTHQIESALKLGNRPLLWVQGGLDERVAEALKAIDVFSVFDDPYCHKITDPLCAKSRLIVVQNRHAKDLFKDEASKTIQLLPPVDMRSETLPDVEPANLPPGLPDRVMGYIGGFHSQGYDLVMFERFLREFSDWTFLLAGRTDPAGEDFLHRLCKYRNFVYAPWQSRNKIAGLWKRLDLNLLLYRPARVNDGAFPTKILESLFFGVPMVATSVPKTKDLEGLCVRSSFPEILKREFVKVAETPAEDWLSHYADFAYEMDPRNHLARVAEALRD
jgi:glycosyltransferase involved in cell wall biosynthesis